MCFVLCALCFVLCVCVCFVCVCALCALCVCFVCVCFVLCALCFVLCVCVLCVLCVCVCFVCFVCARVCVYVCVPGTVCKTHLAVYAFSSKSTVLGTATKLRQVVAWVVLVARRTQRRDTVVGASPAKRVLVVLAVVARQALALVARDRGAELRVGGAVVVLRALRAQRGDAAQWAVATDRVPFAVVTELARQACVRESLVSVALIAKRAGLLVAVVVLGAHCRLHRCRRCRCHCHCRHVRLRLRAFAGVVVLLLALREVRAYAVLRALPCDRVLLLCAKCACLASGVRMPGPYRTEQQYRVRSSRAFVAAVMVLVTRGA